MARTRNRPLAAGRISAREAVLFVGAQSLVSLGVLAALNGTAALVAIASVPLVIVYPFMKRITYWPQAFLGITFNWGVLVGYAAVVGTVDGLPCCSTPPASSGPWDTTPSTRTRTRRTTP